jgi:hypothetical protein
MRPTRHIHEQLVVACGSEQLPGAHKTENQQDAGHDDCSPPKDHCRAGGIRDLGSKANDDDVDVLERLSWREAMARNSWEYGIRSDQLRIPVGIRGVQGEDGDTRTNPCHEGNQSGRPHTPRESELPGDHQRHEVERDQNDGRDLKDFDPEQQIHQKWNVGGLVQRIHDSALSLP